MNPLYKIAAVVSIISLCVAYYFYTQNKIDTLSGKIDTYEASIKQYKGTINALTINAKEIQKAYAKLDNRLKKSEENNDKLNKILSKHDLTYLAVNKPGLIEKRINDASDKVFDEITKLTDY